MLKKMRWTMLPVLAMMLSVLGSAPAMAGEALEALAGKWVLVSMEGEPAPAEIRFEMNFVDDDTVQMISPGDEGDEPEVLEMRYLATAEGDITVYPPNMPEGDKAKWSVDDKGQLVITADDGFTMSLRRPE